MARRPATTADLAVGVSVFTSRTGLGVPYVVTALEDQPRYPSAGPIVTAQRPGKLERGFAVRELWVSAS